MDRNEKIKIYRIYRMNFGEHAQSEVMSEEIGELLTAKSHYYRGRIGYNELLTECADVLNCIDQLILNISDSEGITYYEVESKVMQIKRQKILRMMDRLEAEK